MSMIVIVVLLFLSVYGILMSDNVWVHLGCGGIMGFVWIQSGWLGHDSGHYQIMSIPEYNRFAQVLTGNFLSGICIFDSFTRFLVSYQNWTFYPVMCLARINLFAQSFMLLLSKRRLRNRGQEVLGKKI
ncbi:hypothetical protein MKX01_004047 [Papaver californicum]|nr:hypothetical protein MKX01_004047 [Papaver californicum]